MKLIKYIVSATLIMLLFMNNAYCQSLIINEILAKSQVDVNGDGKVDANDEFVEFLNKSEKSVSISGWTISDNTSIRYTFPTGTIVPSSNFVVVFGGDNSAADIGSAIVKYASALDFDSIGDMVVLKNGEGDIIDKYEYGSEAAEGQSIARTNDEGGEFIQHSILNSPFSPGKNNTKNINNLTVAPIITATMTDALVVDINSSGNVNPGEQLEYTIVISNVGALNAESVKFVNTVDANTTLVPGSIEVIPPLAIDDSFTATGNITIFKAANGVLNNDGGSPTTITEVQGSSGNVGVKTATSAAGLNGITGFVTLNSNGEFTYMPPPGYTGNDTFTYTNDIGSNIATVTVTISDMVWFIDNSISGGGNNGTFSDPFESIADFNTAVGSGTGTKPKDGDLIYIYHHTSDYTNGITLLSNHKLYGDKFDLTTVLTIDANSVSTVNDGSSVKAVNDNSSTKPSITSLSTHGIVLASNNTIRGLNLGNTPSGTSIVDGGGSVGNLTISDVSVSGTGGGIDIDNGGSLAIVLSSLSSASAPDDGINLSGVSGTFDITGSVNITNPTNQGIDLASSSATFTFSGTTKTVNTGSSNAVVLTSNSGSINFTNGGLDIDATTGSGFNATGGGTINIIGSNNTITSTTGIAINIDNTTIGASGVTFKSISVNGAVNGIKLINTGTSGGLMVTGDGSTTQGGNDTGGIIENTTGDGIVLTNTKDVSLKNMTIGDITASAANSPDATNNIAGDGIEATGATNLTLESVTIARTDGHGINAVSVASAPSLTNLVVNDCLILNAGDGQEEHGLNLDELRGENFVRRSLFDAFNETGIELINTSGTVDFTVDNTTFQDNQSTVGNAGEEAILVEAQGSATIIFLVTGASVFDDIALQSVDVKSIGTTSMAHVTVENSSFLENNSGDGIIIMNPDGTGSGNITVKNNTFTDDTFGPFAVLLKNDSSGELDATVQGNAVNLMQLMSLNHDDIGGSGSANGTSKLLVGGDLTAEGNNVTVGSNNIAIDIIATESGPVGTAPDVSLTILKNTTSQPDGNFTFVPGLRVEAQNNTRLNANISGNSFQGDPSTAGGSGIELREFDSAVVGIEGFSGGTTAAAASFIDGQNPGSVAGSFLNSHDNNFNSGTAMLPTATTRP